LTYPNAATEWAWQFVFPAGRICRDERYFAVPCFVKQLGAKPFYQRSVTMGTPFVLHVNDRKGGDPAEWPGHLRVREFPAIAPMPT
jgi:hypothetical protein